MARSPVQAWLFDEIATIDQYQTKSPEFHLIIKSISKYGLKANYFIPTHQSETPEWILNFFRGNPGDFFIEGSGRYQLANINENEQELYLSKSNFPFPSLEIFFSFQSDNEKTSSAIKNTLGSIINNLNNSLDKPLSLIVSESDNPGAGDINQNIRKKINSCLAFIADLTPIYKNDKGKFFYNSNVLMEIGYAFAKKKESQILLILPTVHTEWEKNAGDIQQFLPFDIKPYKILPVKKVKNFHDIDKALKEILKKLNIIKE